jgi:hypothetical protein
MGRPLNKKYFGNRNVGTAVTADDGIGGNQVASVTLGTLGAYTTRPSTTFSDPDNLALGGVRATGSVTSEVESATAIGGTMVGYEAGDILTVTTSAGTATFTVDTIGGTGGDDVTAVSPLDRGTFLYASGALATGAQATTVTHANGSASTATGATLTLRYRAKAVLMINNGSGYTDPTDATVSFSQSVTGASVMGSSAIVGQNENAIIAFAKTTSGGTRQRADIIKQTNAHSYKVRTADGTAVCKLRTDGGTGVNTMDITAYDTAGDPGVAGEYWVSKLTGRTATLVAKGGGIGGTDFTNGKQVKWTLESSAVAPVNGNIGTAKIQNS